MVVADMFRPAVIIAMRPATCIGPIKDAAHTAVEGDAPRSSNMGMMWLIIIPCVSAKRGNAAARYQNTGDWRAALAALLLTEAIGKGVVACASKIRVEMAKSGTPTSKIEPANHCAALRQPSAAAIASAMG